MALAALLAAAGCVEEQPPQTLDLPPPSSRTPLERDFGANAHETTPVRTKVRSSPTDTITYGNYRGGGGGGGGGSITRVRPPGFPRNPNARLEAEDMHGAARGVAGERPRRGSEACEAAFEAMQELRRERQRAANQRATPADRESFMDSCERMPEIEQWCMVPNYIRDHTEECDRRAHTRIQRAIARYEERADGEAEEWAPDEADLTGAVPAAATPEPEPEPVGPRRIGPGAAE
jgi:hypothetical protein